MGMIQRRCDGCGKRRRYVEGGEPRVARRLGPCRRQAGMPMVRNEADTAVK